MNEHQVSNNFINRYINQNIKPTTTEVRQIKRESHKLTDALFWCIYNIIYPNNIIKNYFIEEKKVKFKWMELIKQNKELYKKYILIQPFLICHNKINIPTVDAICHLFNISIILLNDSTYIYLNKTDTKPIFIKNTDNKYIVLKDETYENIVNNYLCIDDYKKLIYAKSRYKVHELKLMALKLCIEVRNKKKNDIYEDINNKLKLIYLNI
jgi:hypothetical protein